METNTYYLKIHSFLSRHEKIWADSILQNWPFSRAHFPEAWLTSVSTLQEEELEGFANGLSRDTLDPALKTLVTESQSFELDVSPVEYRLDTIDAQGLNAKKQHEIERLLPILQNECPIESVTHAVDIGGGMGHLARLCVKHFQWRFHTIDKDSELQTKGEWWLKRSRNLDRSKLTFVNSEVNGESQSIDRYFQEPETLSLGLHTCGSLAVAQFRKSLRSDLVINFGCCFDKTQLDDLNLSQLAKLHPIAWNQPVLFLATRGRNFLTTAEFQLLKRVNDYRFALHLYFQKLYPEKGFIIAGDAPKSLYQKSFADYARDRFEKLGFSGFSAESASAFFHEEATQKSIREIFCAHLIRNLFARPLELILLADRALWLEDEGFQAKLVAAFDRDISPRNVALIARRLNPRGTNP